MRCDLVVCARSSLVLPDAYTKSAHISTHTSFDIKTVTITRPPAKTLSDEDVPSGVPAKKAAAAVATGLRLRGGGESAIATLLEENPLLPYLCGSLVAAGAGVAAWCYYNQDPLVRECS